LCDYIDAFSVDLKAFDEQFYKRLTGASLEPVLRTAKAIRKMGKHLEITNLVITKENDDPALFTSMVKWIAAELGPDTVLHISRYFPTYKMDRDATPVSTLNAFFDIASEHLDYVYLGNVRSEKGQNTCCKKCGELAISRYGYVTTWEGLDEFGNCVVCGNHIISK
ncbi:MAG: AmmeMemoRadiSam system radical SAM enzyme, partial [Bacteroidota bacterium]|nr:AmmeMemoRadiSam system radical SAM enzyme [Bacteroidota bacterium]